MNPLQIITTNVGTHLAVRSWLALPPQVDGFRPVVPARLEVLHRSDKTTVYRLPQVGHGAGDVIVKKCLPAGARVEREVYPLLERLGCASTRYYGCVEATDHERSWLFLEDAAGERFDPKCPEHRHLAARWLAHLHTSSASLGGIPELPERGAAHYLEHLRAAREIMHQAATTREFSAQHRAVLAEVHRVLDRAEAQWDVVERTCSEMPWALVHADFGKKNIRVRNGSAGNAAILAFDWEVSGWGLPAVDLRLADLDMYYECVRLSWPHLTPATLKRLAQVGRLMRGGIAAVRWEAECLETDWLDNIIANMRIYLRRIAVAFDALGLQA